jgi:hypothetical protein
MRRRSFVFGLISSLVATLSAKTSRAQAWSLITQEEYEREREASQREPLSDPRSEFVPQDPSAPKIEIKQPDPSRPIKTPVTIIVVFIAGPDAKIDVSSFRAEYGAYIKIPITDKIKQNAKLDETGLRAEGVGLPSGNHTVTISIADDRKRIAIRTIQFVVT